MKKYSKSTIKLGKKLLKATMPPDTEDIRWAKEVIRKHKLKSKIGFIGKSPEETGLKGIVI